MLKQFDLEFLRNKSILLIERVVFFSIEFSTLIIVEESILLIPRGLKKIRIENTKPTNNTIDSITSTWVCPLLEILNFKFLFFMWVLLYLLLSSSKNNFCSCG